MVAIYHPTAVCADKFKSAMSRLSYSVSVVTVECEGRHYGKTINTLAPVSAETPSILISLFRRSDFTSRVIERRAFCVSVLNERQKAVAEAFASNDGDPFGFCEQEVHATGGCSIRGAVASFDCTLAQIIVHGSHVVLIGAVKGLNEGEHNPLLHHKRAYRIAGQVLTS